MTGLINSRKIYLNPHEKDPIQQNAVIRQLAQVAANPQHSPATITTTYTMLATDDALIFNGGATISVTLLSAANYPGRSVLLKTVAAQAVISAAVNIIALASTTASSAILSASAGKWANLRSDAVNWVIMAAN